MSQDTSVFLSVVCILVDAVIDFITVLKGVPKVPDVQMDTIICAMATAFSHYLGQKNFTEKQKF